MDAETPQAVPTRRTLVHTTRASSDFSVPIRLLLLLLLSNIIFRRAG